MEINDVIWLDDIVEKIATKHNVATAEVEDVLLRRPEFRRGGRGRRRCEDLYYALGRPDGICSLCLFSSVVAEHWS